MHPYVYSNTIYNSQDTESTLLSIDRWMNKEDVVYIYNGILLSHKKWMKCCHLQQQDGLGGYYAKWNKSDRQRQILYDITYMWNLKNKTN